MLIVEPFDSVVFDRAVNRDGLHCVAPRRLAAALLTGRGREPSQGEHVLLWMEKNEHVWQSAPPSVEPDVIAASFAVLVSDLLAAVNRLCVNRN